VARRPALTLRLRLTLLYGALLAVVAATLLAVAVVVLDRALRALPRFSPNVRLNIGDGRSLTPDQFSQLLRDSARSELIRSAGVVFAVVAVVGLVAAYVVAGRALQPVSRVTSTARRLSEETLDHRIALDGPPDELKELADTFDAMLARLDAAFDSQRRFVANASHELRTPLSVIRTEVDVTLGDPAASVADLRTMGEVVREASMRADRLVDALLVLARSDGQAREGLDQREPVDLASLVPAAVAAVAPEASARRLQMSTETRPAPVEGDPQLLERLVGNLVENAVRHNVDGGWVTVRTGTESGAFLSVLNTGPAVPAGEVEELFQPFRRGGTARTGSRGAGLGLSIVRAVAAAHGGAVSAAPRVEGGLEVTVHLPAPTRAAVPV